MIDFSTWPQNKFRSYGGANGKKQCRMQDGVPYMVKIFEPSGKTKPMSAFSEYISCHVYEMIGIPVQETILGCFQGPDEAPYMAVACKDFCGKNDVLREFSEVRNSIISSSDDGTNKRLVPILISLQEQDNIPVPEFLNRFWDMVVVDAFIGNFDRHTGNFGILSNEAEQQQMLAPVYDCGSALYPSADDFTIEKILGSEQEQLTRIYEFPASTYRDENDQKIKYLDLLTSEQYPECQEALKRIQPRIDMERIRQFIYGIAELSPIRKEFYCTMLNLRKERLIDFAYEKAMAAQQTAARNSPSELTDIHHREQFLLKATSFQNDCDRRYAQLYRKVYQTVNAGRELGKHLRNTDLDAAIVAILRKEKTFSTRIIKDTLERLSPTAIGINDYASKMVMKSKGIKFREVSADTILLSQKHMQK